MSEMKPSPQFSCQSSRDGGSGSSVCVGRVSNHDKWVSNVSDYLRSPNLRTAALEQRYKKINQIINIKESP